MLYDFLLACGHNYTNTLLNIAEKCGFIKRTIALVREAPSNRSLPLSFLLKVGHLLSPAEIVNIRRDISLNDFLSLIPRLPISKRSPEFTRDLARLIQEGYVREGGAGTVRIEKLSTAVMSLVGTKPILVACQIHSLCYAHAKGIYGVSHYIIIY